MSFEFNDFVGRVLTEGRDHVTFDIMLTRALLGYVFGTFVIRWHKHFLGFGSSFDIVVRIVIGSLLASAIGGSLPFVPTLAAITSLVAINWGLGVLMWRFPSLENHIKGSTVLLFENGQFNERAMRNYAITYEDIFKVVREQMHTDNLSVIKLITLENSGKISVVKKV